MKGEDASGARRQRRHVDPAWAVVAAICVLLAQGFLQLDYRWPLSISGDHFFLMIPEKMLSHGDFWSTDLLGYPLGHNTIFFPDFEILLKITLFGIASIGFGPFIAVKIFYFVGLAAMAMGSFWCLRKVSIAPWLACVGAVAFVVSPYFAVRAVNHDFLSIYLTAPFGCTLAILISSCDGTEQIVDLLKSRFGIVALIVVAGCGLYYAFFSVLFIGAACLAVSVKTRRLGALLCWAGLSAVISVILLVGALGPNLPTLLSGHWVQPVRLPVEQLYHGLSISDALLTLQDIGAFSSHTARYLEMRPHVLIGEGGGWPGLVLTTTILLCPLIVLSRLSSPQSDESRAIMIGTAAGFVVFGLIFASRGGLGYLFNDLINPTIRGQNRIISFLAFFALVILAQTSEMLMARTGLLALAGPAIPALLLLAAIPSFGTIRKVQARSLADPSSVAIEKSMTEMIAAKNAHVLRAVLEMPIEPWPESQPRNGFWTYNFALPFIFDTARRATKWSYGSAALQDGFGEFRAEMRGEYDPAGLPRRALARGFDGILIEKGELTSSELNRLETHISLPISCRIYNDALQELFSIDNSACSGTAPVAAPPSLDFGFTAGNDRELLASGWDTPEAPGVWAINRRSILILPKPSDGDVSAVLSFSVFRASLGTKTIRVYANGHRLEPITVSPAGGPDLSAYLKIPAIVLAESPMLRLEFEYLNAESPASAGSADTRTLGMFLRRLTLTSYPG